MSHGMKMVRMRLYVRCRRRKTVGILYKREEMVVDCSYLQSPGVFIPPVANYLHPLFLFSLFFSDLHLFFGASVTRDRATLGATLSHNYILPHLDREQSSVFRN
jgi:hypothetical protein